MSNEQKNSRTVIEDLPVAEQELTADEMGKVQGGDTIKTPPPTCSVCHKSPCVCTKPVGTSTNQGTSFGN